MSNANNCRLMKLWINLDEIKNKDQFLNFIDLILKREFVNFYDAESIINYLVREEKAKLKDKTIKREKTTSRTIRRS